MINCSILIEKKKQLNSGCKPFEMVSIFYIEKLKLTLVSLPFGLLLTSNISSSFSVWSFLLAVAPRIVILTILACKHNKNTQILD